MPSIYLSPSLQPYNEYAGGGNEQEYMNRIADEMEPYLKANGIVWERNTIGTNVGAAIRESNSGYYDLHLALHSNAGPESLAAKMQGTDIYYYPESQNGRQAADILAENFKTVYPEPEKVKTLPTRSLAEVVKTNAPAVLMEVAYHDNPEDAQWIRSHTEEIAKNIVKGLTQYFGLPFIDAIEPERIGIVVTQATPLNIREYPSRQAPVIGQAPKGAEVAVLGMWEDWYVIRYGDHIGYAAREYIRA